MINLDNIKSETGTFRGERHGLFPPMWEVSPQQAKALIESWEWPLPPAPPLQGEYILGVDDCYKPPHEGATDTEGHLSIIRKTTQSDGTPVAVYQHSQWMRLGESNTSAALDYIQAVRNKQSE